MSTKSRVPACPYSVLFPYLTLFALCPYLLPYPIKAIIVIDLISVLRAGLGISYTFSFLHTHFLPQSATLSTRAVFFWPSIRSSLTAHPSLSLHQLHAVGSDRASEHCPLRFDHRRAGDPGPTNLLLHPHRTPCLTFAAPIILLSRPIVTCQRPVNALSTPVNNGQSLPLSKPLRTDVLVRTQAKPRFGTCDSRSLPLEATTASTTARLITRYIAASSSAVHRYRIPKCN